MKSKGLLMILGVALLIGLVDTKIVQAQNPGYQPTPAYISGSVTNSETGKGIEGATVSAYFKEEGDLFTGITGKNGLYDIRIGMGRTGEAEVGVTALDYEKPEQQSVYVEVGRVVSCNFVLSPIQQSIINVTVILPDGTTKEGIHVYGRMAVGDGWEIKSAYTDEQGKATLKYGQVRDKVIVGADTWQDGFQYVADEVEVKLEGDTYSVQLILKKVEEQCVKIKGCVYAGSSPADNANVSVKRACGDRGIIASTTTDSEGKYEFKSCNKMLLEPGMLVEIWAKKESYRGFSGPVVLVPGDNNIDVRMKTRKNSGRQGR